MHWDRTQSTPSSHTSEDLNPFDDPHHDMLSGDGKHRMGLEACDGS